MTQITMDHTLTTQLNRLTEQVEIVDEEGRVIGLFTPVLSPPYDEAWIPPMSQSDFEAAANDGPGITTAELLQRLENA